MISRLSELTNPPLGSWAETVALRERSQGCFQCRCCCRTPNQHLHLVAIRRNIFIGNRPVHSQAVVAVGFEIVGAVAQGNSPPVIGAPAHDSRTPPGELPRPNATGCRFPPFPSQDLTNDRGHFTRASAYRAISSWNRIAMPRSFRFIEPLAIGCRSPGSSFRS